MTAPPLIVEVVRNGFVESRHRVCVVGLAADGGRAFDSGEVDAPVFPRSCAKPLQALALLRAGWDPADEEQVALACASHSGEAAHLAVVRRILAQAGVGEERLDNTPGLPLDGAAARELLAGGGDADPLHHNCSGKHAAMLAACVANGWPLTGYRDRDHPVQQAVRSTVEAITGEPVAAVGVDGCGAALFATTLGGLATAFARIATGRVGTAERRVADAMRAHPFLVGGTARDVTVLMQSVEGLVAKDGAEGMYAAALADGRAVALKVEDGAGRARTPAMVHALRRLGLAAPGLDALEDVPVLGHGEPVGAVVTA